MQKEDREGLREGRICPLPAPSTGPAGLDPADPLAGDDGRQHVIDHGAGDEVGEQLWGLRDV